MTRDIKVINGIEAMKKLSESIRKKGSSIGLVPTMGYLHEGHMSLVRRARKECDILVVSIFVNPMQFGPKEDLKRYPRDFSRDKRLLRDAGVDVIFYPAVKQMYPEGYRTYIYVNGLSDVLCGAARTGHFRGVATVVAKLFNIVKPDTAYFGKKDFQQQVIIRKMAKDLNMDTKIVSMPIIRETDGLAMSSRNKYLSKDERKNAAVVSSALRSAKVLIGSGVRSPEKIRSAMLKLMRKIRGVKVDYISICDPNTLEEKKTIKGRTVIAAAAYIGKIRLIDNILVG